MSANSYLTYVKCAKELQNIENTLINHFTFDLDNLKMFNNAADTPDGLRHPFISTLCLGPLNEQKTILSMMHSNSIQLNNCSFVKSAYHRKKLKSELF